MIWYFDSGASRHITSRKDLFCSLDAAPAGKKVTCANNASYPIKGVGKILITISDGSDLCLPDVLYVPGIKKNLLSVSSLAKNGLRVIFEDDRCIVRDRENGYSLITTGTLENGLFVLDCYEKQIRACITETKTQAMQDAELWHARFGHVGYGSLMTLQRHNMVHDLSLLEMPPRHVYEGCVLGKMHRFAFSQDGSVRATRKLFCWVYPLKAKSDVFAVFQHYVSMVENETGCKIQTLRTDRGGEYMSGAFKDFLGKKGIKHQCTMPYTPQQNGVAERKNRSLMEMARCMLKAKSLPHKLWMEAVACAAHVLNRCPTRALKTITPYESWYDRKPSVSYLRVFGCLAYAHIPQQLRGKLDDKAVKCIFVGYSSGSKGYRLYNPVTNKIFESRDVIFAETTAQPMVAFDVPHIQTQDVFEGFLPSFVENQESQQVDNFDQSFDQHVTPHDVEEIVREEQEVLREERTLPKWVQKTLQDSKLDAPLPRKTRAGTTFGREQIVQIVHLRAFVGSLALILLLSGKMKMPDCHCKKRASLMDTQSATAIVERNELPLATINLSKDIGGVCRGSRFEPEWEVVEALVSWLLFYRVYQEPPKNNEIYLKFATCFVYERCFAAKADSEVRKIAWALFAENVILSLKHNPVAWKSKVGAFRDMHGPINVISTGDSMPGPSMQADVKGRPELCFMSSVIEKLRTKILDIQSNNKAEVLKNELKEKKAEFLNKRDALIHREATTSTASMIQTKITSLQTRYGNLKGANATAKQLAAVEAQITAMSNAVKLIKGDDKIADMKIAVESIERDVNLLESKLSCSLHYMSFFENMMKQLANGCTLLLSPAFYAPEEGQTNRADFYSNCVACDEPLAATNAIGVYMLPCGHKYHSMCFASTLVSKQVCVQLGCNQRITESVMLVEHNPRASPYFQEPTVSNVKTEVSGWSNAEAAHHMSFETGHGYTENAVGVEEGNVSDLGIANPGGAEKSWSDHEVAKNVGHDIVPLESTVLGATSEEGIEAVLGGDTDAESVFLVEFVKRFKSNKHTTTTTAPREGPSKKTRSATQKDAGICLQIDSCTTPSFDSNDAHPKPRACKKL
ncbi:hypothetical protein L7F22_048403 [Adiantum nelumboides]|nr:hypothetical protein [Adiantum nelumboides]